MPELSIIVPVYKVEKYLSKCIESILAQTFTDFECILIDDGSPDKCGEICEEYAAKDSRIRVIHQKNQGVSAARNAGLDIATGTYLGFVDSDDSIEPEMYETMIKIAKDNQLDIVACESKYSCNPYKEDRYFNRNELLSALYTMPNPVHGCIWNKLYLHSKICDVRYRNGVAMAEDRMFLFDCFCHCDSAIKISNPLYNVVNRDDSATHTLSVDVPYKMVTGSHKLMKLAKGYSFDLECLATDKFLDDCLVHIPKIIKIGKKEHQHYRLKVVNGKILMICAIIKSFFRRMLSASKVRGYIYEMVKIR